MRERERERVHELRFTVSQTLDTFWSFLTTVWSTDILFWHSIIYWYLLLLPLPLTTLAIWEQVRLYDTSRACVQYMYNCTVSGYVYCMCGLRVLLKDGSSCNQECNTSTIITEGTPVIQTLQLTRTELSLNSLILPHKWDWYNLKTHS